MAWKIGKLTEEGKQVFSWQFDEGQDMDQIRGVTDTSTGEIVLAIKVSKEQFYQMQDRGQVFHIKEIQTKKGIWFMFDDKYDTYIYREGDILNA